MSRYTIAQVAERTGFSPSTLRYYDGLGLVQPVERTEAGYRLYDDDAVARLDLVARTKRLGLSLDDARDLTTLWASGECGDVQARLRELVAERIAATQDSIAERMAMAADLQAVAAHLSSEPAVAGACDDACACMTEPAPTVTRGLQIVPKDADDSPLVCTLQPGAMPDRLHQWRAAMDRAVARTAIPDGVRVVFPSDPDLAAELGRLAVLEQACCAFFTFALRATSGRVELDVEAPDGARALIDTIFGVADGTVSHPPGRPPGTPGAGPPVRSAERPPARNAG